MTVTPFVVAVATFLGCYAFVMIVAWFRVMAREDIKAHIPNVAMLLGVLVPVVATFLGVVLLASVFRIPELALALVLIIPAGVAVAFQLEVSRLRPVGVRFELMRLGTAAVLAGVVIVSRGGL